MKSSKTLQILNAVAFVLMTIVNYLAVALPINGKSPKQLSDAIPNLFVPADFTFSIWSIIYLLLFIFIIAQFKGFVDKINQAKAVNQIGYLFFISCLLNSFWIIAWHYQYVVIALIIMICLLVCLVKIYNNLHIGIPTPLKNKIFFQIPFSVYLGWITIATIANVTAVLVSYGFYAFGNFDVLLTLLVLIIGFIITLRVLTQKADYAFALVIIWAYFGIYFKRSVTEPVLNSIIWVCLAVIIFLSITILYVLWQNNKNQISSK